MTPQDVIIGCLSDGQISVDRNGIVTRTKNRKPTGGLHPRGYMVCRLKYKDTQKQVKVHQVVWIAFNGPITKGMVLDHINRVPTDNKLSNLRMVTPSENLKNRTPVYGIINNAKLSYDSADQIRKLRSEGVPVKLLAEMFSVGTTTIKRVIRGLKWNRETPARVINGVTISN